VGWSVVEVEVAFLDALAVNALRVGQAEQALFDVITIRSLVRCCKKQNR
jgi:hypothetical protein